MHSPVLPGSMQSPGQFPRRWRQCWADGILTPPRLCERSFPVVASRHWPGRPVAPAPAVTLRCAAGLADATVDLSEVHPQDHQTSTAERGSQSILPAAGRSGFSPGCSCTIWVLLSYLPPARSMNDPVT
jgi:hypothetical protein